MLDVGLRSKILMNDKGEVFRYIAGEQRVDAEKKGVIEAPLSSLRVDSYNSITWFAPVEWGGKKYELRTYLGDPDAPFLVEHGFEGGSSIGTVDNFTIEGDAKSADTKLMARFNFDMVDPAAAFRYGKHERKIIKGFSQRFTADRVLFDDDADEFLKAQGREERGVIVFLGLTILEGSSVQFPANIDARVRSTLVQHECLGAECETLKQLNKFKEETFRRLQATGNAAREDTKEDFFLPTLRKRS
jgi:hypothetical protein